MSDLRQKKICFVVITPFTVNAFLINHLLALSKNNRVILCVNLSLYELSERILNSHIEVIDVPLRRKISLRSDMEAWWALFQIFCKFQIDSVHSITPKAGLLSMSAAFCAGIPSRFHTFTGQVWVNYTGLKRSFFKAVDKLTAIIATQVFADSKSQINFIVNEKICNSSKILMLGEGSISGVDFSRFSPNAFLRNSLRSQLGVADEVCVFLFVGRICKDKGIIDLLTAFSKINIESSDALLWIVGPEEDFFLEYLRTALPGLIERAKWFGPSLSPEHFMVAADVLLLPSYREGFGSVIIEAAACSLPVIAYRIYGVTDAVIENETGILVSKGDIENFETQMRLLLNNKLIREKMGIAARRRAQLNFSNQLTTGAWLEFYNSFSKKIKMRLSKRIIDIVLAFLASAVFVIPALIIALLIKSTSKGPILYWSDRVGQNNKIFSMPKFRSMNIDAPTIATHLFEDRDRHITSIGKHLRRFSLDELPQIWCVVKGEMSFVGPRPALFNQDDLIRMRTQCGVHILIPGLTGWAQINGRDELNLESKVYFDMQYLERQSLRFDGLILLLTFIKVIRSEGLSH